jgi:hypothetical protein
MSCCSKELEKKYKGALARKKRAEKSNRLQDQRKIPAYEGIVKSDVFFITNKRGPE